MKEEIGLEVWLNRCRVKEAATVAGDFLDFFSLLHPNKLGGDSECRVL